MKTIMKSMSIILLGSLFSYCIHAKENKTPFFGDELAYIYELLNNFDSIKKTPLLSRAWKKSSINTAPSIIQSLLKEEIERIQIIQSSENPQNVLYYCYKNKTNDYIYETTASLCRSKLLFFKFTSLESPTMTPSLQSQIDSYINNSLHHIINDTNLLLSVNLHLNSFNSPAVVAKFSDFIINSFKYLKTSIPEKIQTQILIGKNKNLPLVQNITNEALANNDLQFKNIQQTLQDDLPLKAKIEIDSWLSFLEKEKQNIKLSDIASKLTIIGKAMAYKNERESAQSVFNFFLRFAQTIKHKDAYSEALFLLLWLDLRIENYNHALKTLQRYQLIKRFDTLTRKTQFWVATTLFHGVGKAKEKANYFYHHLIESDPLSYYSIMAMQQLKDLKIRSILDKNQKEQNEINLESNFEETLSMTTWGAQSQRYFFIYETLAHFRYHKLATKILEHFILTIHNELQSDFDFPSIGIKRRVLLEQIKNFTYRKLLVYLSKNNGHLAAFALATKGLSTGALQLDYDLLKILYPAPYTAEISKVALAVQIEPLTLTSLLRQESGFNPEALSPVGAMGLMQVMPQTAKMLDPKVKKKDLNDPETNIRLGIQYLQELLIEFKGNLIDSYAGYNAGPHRVRRWKENAFIVNNEMLKVDSIPFKETRLYVKLITRNYFYYSFLNAKNGPEQDALLTKNFFLTNIPQALAVTPTPAKSKAKAKTKARASKR